MADNENPKKNAGRPERGAIRLTFRSTAGKVELIKHERLDMICPQPPGERPQAGKHSGYWMELRGDGDQVLAHQLLHAPLRDSVAIHSPDGKIKRVFGEPADGVFEVLLPDNAAARAVVFMGVGPVGKSEGKAKRAVATGASELARFDLPGTDKNKKP
jgi:hypothetical protein